MRHLGICLALVFGAGAQVVFAHEGHDHTPGTVQAPHGGMVHGTDSVYVEIVNEASGLKLYPLTHDLTPIPLKDIAITGTFQPPKKKKEPVTFSAVGDHLEAKIDAKGAYRYTLELTAKYKGKTEKLSVHIEPQG